MTDDMIIVHGYRQERCSKPQCFHLARNSEDSVTFTTMHADNHKHIILYAEDDPDDLFMISQVFNELQNTELLHARNGYEAVQQLQQSLVNQILPCLIILDVNMPGMNGRDALVHIRQAEDFKNIPVVLFTTSSSDHDRVFAKKWGAEFVTKPVMYPELQELARKFISYCTGASPGTFTN